jgi:hypothetical protein
VSSEHSPDDVTGLANAEVRNGFFALQGIVGWNFLNRVPLLLRENRSFW